MENKRQLEISYSFGYIFDKSKVIVVCPVGSNIIDEEEFDMDVEAAFLEDGVDRAFSEQDVEGANKEIAPLTTFLGRYSDIIPLVNEIKNNDTKEVLEYLFKKFKVIYKPLEDYRDYEIKSIDFMYENIQKYIPKHTDLDYLNILKIEANKFDLDRFVKEGNSDPIFVRKSKMLNHVFVALENNNKEDIKDNSKFYIMFADENDVLVNEDIDYGDIILDENNDAGFLVELSNGNIEVKIGNYNHKSPTGQQIVEVVEDSGIFKNQMNEFVNKFIKNI